MRLADETNPSHMTVSSRITKRVFQHPVTPHAPFTAGGGSFQIELNEGGEGILEVLEGEVPVLGDGTADAESAVRHADPVLCIELAEAVEPSLDFSLSQPQFHSSLPTRRSLRTDRFRLVPLLDRGIAPTGLS